MIKVCTKCKEEKPLSSFRKNICQKDHLHSHCRICEKEYRDKNKKRVKKYNIEYREINKEKIAKQREGKYSRIKNKEEYKKWLSKYMVENNDLIKKRKSEWYHKNHERESEKRKNYYKENKDIHSKRAKEYAVRNREKINKYHRNYRKKRCNNDPGFKIMKNIRTRIYDALIKNIAVKSSKTTELLGCSVLKLKEHLESKFTDGMTWDNYGYYGWHIDHIKPCAKFDLTDPEQQKECFRYSNLQPLWWKDNFKKSDNWDEAYG